MYILYDGTFEGLLTVIFSKYREVEYIYDINILGRELNFVAQGEFVKTDIKKAERVLTALKKDFSYRVLLDIKYCFNSKFQYKDRVIAKVVKKIYSHGESFLNSADKNMIEFSKIVKNVSSERHAYLGLLRFSEIEGGYLFAEFEPENNVLPLIMNHFKKRLSSENFAIYDTNRKMVGIYENGEIGIFEMEESDYVLKEGELEYREMWKNFYNSISIESRKNVKLKISNMPKKYWKHLTELK